VRLSKIKLAGFKSFVDPISIDFQSNLTGIIGPNGCGKSNTIDAVRWVMGESSAKHLRGGSMEDVIFNGSSERKPVGQASVELVFDNSDASLGGEYARFAEIAVKRQVARDGQSKYFLNGSRCRRRDITDIFLGTGLGPRSYAIIEQGMISRLIEAKPEELRTYLEEAAGISKYRQRRRETENRIRHTKDNLDRLSDLREEIEKHIKQLKRQANAAERFKDFKSRERQLEAELIALRLQAVRHDITQHETLIATQGTLQQEKMAVLRSLETDIEKLRTSHTESHETQNRIQGEFYKAGAEITRLEQIIRHQQETRQRLQVQIDRAEQELHTSQQHITEDKQALEQANADLREKEPELENLRIELEAAHEKLHVAEAALADWQNKWDTLQQQISEPTQQAQFERARMEQLERQIQQNVQRQEKIRSSQNTYPTDELASNLETHQEALRLLNNQLATSQEELSAVEQESTDKESQKQELETKIDALRSELQAMTGRLASLEALQQAGLGKENHSLNHWLKQQGLQDKQRVAENLKIESGWEKALETVLGEHLEALQVDDLNSLKNKLAGLPEANISFITGNNSQATAQNRNNSLLQKIQPPHNMSSLLQGIYCVGSLDEALRQQADLAPGESFITKDGIWVGTNWLRINRQKNERSGALQRSQEIKSLKKEYEVKSNELTTYEAQLKDIQNHYKDSEIRKTELQQQINQFHRERARNESAVSNLQNRINQMETRQQQTREELLELEQAHEELQAEHINATQNRNHSVTLMESLSTDKEKLQASRQALNEAVVNSRRTVQDTQNKFQQLQLEVGNLKSVSQNSLQQLSRMDERLAELIEHKEALLQQQMEEDNPEEELTQQLEQQLTQQKKIETRLNEARTNLQSIEHSIRERDTERVNAEHEVEKVRAVLEEMKLKWQETRVREQTLQEQLTETEFEFEELQQQLTGDESIADHQKQLEVIQQKIQRLGAINLAAIDEYKEESERKEYLDKQNNDLIEALEILESAIRKIDRDTRSRFKDTFDRVNARIQEMFPRLFGGGQAHLEMTDDDLLTTGVTIMAKPPGKRITNIHLMSGGEKALTAVAMVFAIFELNPAPFCMLDEVDAPLDDANVGRFCELVKHMSDRIQFIFITHNKNTMELAENLIGVTMRELGVSRTVAVDVEEAAKMAQA
jgi:chromosome segregation protein